MCFKVFVEIFCGFICYVHTIVTFLDTKAGKTQVEVRICCIFAAKKYKSLRLLESFISASLLSFESLSRQERSVILVSHEENSNILKRLKKIRHSLTTILIKILFQLQILVKVVEIHQTTTRILK